jgi:hypothetical protein
VENNDLQKENTRLLNEVERLKKSLEGHKKAIQRWRMKATGEKNYNRKSININYNIKSVNLIINDIEKFKERLIIDTDLPSECTIDEARDFFESLELDNILGKKYVIKEANRGKKVWSMIVVR